MTAIASTRRSSRRLSSISILWRKKLRSDRGANGTSIKKTMNIESHDEENKEGPKDSRVLILAKSEIYLCEFLWRQFYHVRCLSEWVECKKSKVLIFLIFHMW